MKKDLQLSSVKVLGLSFGFVLQIFFIKIIGLKEYGTYVLFTTWTGFLSIILFLGYDKLIIKQIGFYFISNDRSKLRFLLVKLAILVLINSLVFIFVAFIIPHNLLTITLLPSEIPRSTWLLIAVGTVIFTFYEFLGKLLVAVQRVELSFVRSEIICKVFWFIIVLGLLFSFKSYSGINIIIIGLILAQVATFTTILIKLNFYKIIKHLNTNGTKTAIGRDNFFFLFTSINSYIIFQVDKVVIGRNESLDTLGIYGLVVTLVAVASFSTVVYNRYLPKIYSYISNRNFIALEEEFRTITSNALIISLPFISFIIIYTEDVLLFFGEKFITGAPILRILVWGHLTNFLTGPNGHLLTNSNFLRIDFYNSMVIMIVSLGLTLIGYHYFGVCGVAAATSIGLFLNNILRVIQIKYIFHIFPYDLRNILLLISFLLSFYAISTLPLEITNLFIRMIVNFLLSLLTAVASLIILNQIKSGIKLNIDRNLFDKIQF